jgi:pre-mRNA-splicing factor CDC5/CEF1
MRFFVKGGVWKNSEDEILKAGIMKYGKNNWARVASLLPRKSSKQCKSRWFEWLDPSIKKTEWSRDEDEKLLHMVKIMPTQWRSIAPVVGRTAAQCLQRYDQLLEQAAKADAATPEEAEAIANAARDAKRLRPGEIDPDPHVKPARPDAIDMDEDELEMLSEARARLANTKGKKAKRKAREKQLAEARRQAKLQKMRELKEAGLIRGDNRGESSFSSKRKKQREINYNAEIPFHTKAPTGFYDTKKEDAVSRNPEFVKRTRRELTGKIRAEEENKKRKEDKKKHRKLLSANLPSMIDKLSKLNDPRNTIRRSNLVLPSPQVKDEEMMLVAKLTEDAKKRRQQLDQHGSASATRGLLAEPRGATPFVGGGIGGSTPLQPGRTEMRKNTILEQARNLAAMTAQQTPLMGGESFTLEGGTGWSGGAQPTPAPVVSTSSHGAVVGGVGSETPLFGKRPHSELSMSSSYDGIDEEDSRPSRKRQRQMEQRRRNSLRAKLAGLPEPQYTYDVELPELSESSENDLLSRNNRTMDAAEVDRLHREEQNEKDRLDWMRQSSAVKLELPRPDQSMVTNMWLKENDNHSVEGVEMTEIDRQIRDCSFALMWKDAEDKPYLRPGAVTSGLRAHVGKKPNNFPSVKDVEDRFTRAADLMIKKEQDRRGVRDIQSMVDAHETIQAHETMVWEKEHVAEHNASLLALVDAQRRQSEKLKKKITVLTKGHRKRNEDTWINMINEHSKCSEMSVELATMHYSVSFQSEEARAAAKKIEDEISFMLNKERELQNIYAAKH